MIRVVDDSGEDYLYPRDKFVDAKLTAVVEQALASRICIFVDPRDIGVLRKLRRDQRSSHSGQPTLSPTLRNTVSRQTCLRFSGQRHHTDL